MASARVFLSDARVEVGFRDALFAACDRSGMLPGEFALVAAAEKLARAGVEIPGVFRKGDLAGVTSSQVGAH